MRTVWIFIDDLPFWDACSEAEGIPIKEASARVESKIGIGDFRLLTRKTKNQQTVRTVWIFIDDLPFWDACSEAKGITIEEASARVESKIEIGDFKPLSF